MLIHACIVSVYFNSENLILLNQRGDSKKKIGETWIYQIKMYTVCKRPTLGLQLTYLSSFSGFCKALSQYLYIMCSSLAFDRVYTVRES